MTTRTTTKSGGMLGAWLALASVSACAKLDAEAEVGPSSPVVVAYGAHTEALTVGSILSLNGTYGSGCIGRDGEVWTVLVDPKATPDHALLSIIQGNAECVLSLTSVRVGAGELYVASAPIVLRDAYSGSGTGFLKDGLGSPSFYADARLDALDFLAPFEISLLYSSDARFDSASTRARYAYTVEVLADSPRSYWRLGDSGSTAVDEMEQNDGTYFGGVTLGAAGALGRDANTAAVFDGVDDWVRVAHQIPDDFSIEFWFKSTQGRNNASQWYHGAGLVDAEVAGATDDFGVSLRADGCILAGTGNPDRTIVSTDAGFNDGAWHHVVFTRTRATGALTLYVDGELQGSTTGGTQSLTRPSFLNFGRLQTGLNYYAGALDEVAVYASALSAKRVLAHYQAGAAAP